MSIRNSLLWQQPLLQFLILGSLLFAIERLVVGSEDDPRRILIDDAKYAEIAGIYRDNQGHAPSEAQMAQLTIKWAQNEVLYREAQLMGLDKGDEMIRQRLILKLRNLLFNRVNDSEITDVALEEWFETNREAYDKPASYTVEQFLVEESGTESADILLASLNRGEPVPEKYVDATRVYGARSADNLSALFGAEGVASLIADSGDSWHIQQSALGTHLVRVIERHPGSRADFASLKKRVRREWETNQQQLQLREALTDIAGAYDVRIELASPPDSWSDERIDEVRLAMGEVP